MRVRQVSIARWQHAQQRQRQYQDDKARRNAGHERELDDWATECTRDVHQRLGELGVTLPPTALIAEVGSGAHGLIWRWPAARRVAIDPLAVFYRQRFEILQARGPLIVAAAGEALPLADATVSLLLCDNVIDHARDPAQFLRECARVLAPGGWFYFTVHVHHWVYGVTGRAYNALHRVGVALDVPAFPSHTFHFTTTEVDALIKAANFRVVARWSDRAPAHIRPGRITDHLKRWLPKNATMRLLLRR